MKLVTLTQGKPFNEICTEIDRLIGNNFQRVKIPVISNAASLRSRVLSKFSKLVALRGTTGADYLNYRGIFNLPAEAIRFNDKQRHNGRVFQSLYSLATDDKGELCYLHQTLLDGAKKADIGSSAKRLKSLQEDNYRIMRVQLRSECFPSPLLWASLKASKRRCLLTKFTR